MSWAIYANGVLTERGDDSTRQVYDGAGAVVRDYTPGETQQADQLAAYEAEQAVADTLEGQVAAEVQTIRDAIGPGDAPGGTDSLNALINQTNAVINNNPAATIKPALRIVRSIARATIRIARVVVRDYNTPASD